MVQERQHHRTVDASVAVEMDVENEHLETLVAFHVLEVESVAGPAENEELTVEVTAEMHAVVVAV